MSCYTHTHTLFHTANQLKMCQGPEEERFLEGLKEMTARQCRPERSAKGWEEEYLNTYHSAAAHYADRVCKCFG